jgi:hypothetical protein
MEMGITGDVVTGKDNGTNALKNKKAFGIFRCIVFSSMDGIVF